MKLQIVRQKILSKCIPRKDWNVREPKQVCCTMSLYSQLLRLIFVQIFSQDYE